MRRRGLLRAWVLVGLGGCSARAPQGVHAPRPAPVRPSEAAAPGFEPVVAIAQEFPANLDDEALAWMYTRHHGFAGDAFHEEHLMEGDFYLLLPRFDGF